MFTRNGAMAGFVTGAVTAGMGFGMIAPMVAYADTTDDSAQSTLSSTQKSYLKGKLREIKDAIAEVRAAATKDLGATSADWLDTYMTAYTSKIDDYMDEVDSGDRSRCEAVQTKIEQMRTYWTQAYNSAPEDEKAAITAGSTSNAPKKTFTAIQNFEAVLGNADDAFTKVVTLNQDPDSAEFPGLSWSDPMKVTTYTGTFEEDYGTYANFDLSYKRVAGDGGYIQWTMPPELADSEFTIVTEGMLAPQASIPTYGGAKGSRAPEMYVSEDKKTLVVEIPAQVDNNGHANGTFSFAIRSPRKQTAAGESLEAFLAAKADNDAYTHVPAPVALNGTLEDAAKGMTKQTTMGDRDTKKTFVMKFNSNGGTYIPERTITDANLANFQNWGKNLPSPSKTGFRFVGWFSDEACTKVFDPFQVELKDMTLYAKYVQTVQPESTNNNNANAAGRGAANKGDLVKTGETNAYIATVAAVTVGAGLAVTVLRRRSK